MIRLIRSKASARSITKSLKLEQGEGKRSESFEREWSSHTRSMEVELEQFTPLDGGWDAQRSPPPHTSGCRLEAQQATRSVDSPDVSLHNDSSVSLRAAEEYLQRGDDDSSSSSQDALLTPCTAFDTVDNITLEPKALHSPMSARSVDVTSSRMTGSTSVDSQQDFFKVHWAKAGPVPPARRAVRAKISTRAMTPSPSLASVQSYECKEDEKQGSRCMADAFRFAHAGKSLALGGVHSLQGGREHAEEVTQDSSRTSTATIVGITSSTFDTAGNRAKKFSLTSSTDVTDARTPLRSELETSVTSSAAAVADVPPAVECAIERLKTLLVNYNASVQKASAAIYLSTFSPVQNKDESLSPRTSATKYTLPRPLRRLGLANTPLEHRKVLLEALLQHLIHAHFYEEIVEVFCYGCGTKADDAAKALMMYLKSSIPLPSLLTYQSRTYSLLSSTLSARATKHHASQTLTRLHAQIAALFIWCGVVSRRSEAASHTMKGYGGLKTAKDALVALSAGLREQQEGWMEVVMEPRQREWASNEADGEELPIAPNCSDAALPAATRPPPPAVLVEDTASSTDERMRRSLSASSRRSPVGSASPRSQARRASKDGPAQEGSRTISLQPEVRGEGDNRGDRSAVFLVQNFGLTILPCLTTGSKGQKAALEEKTYTRLLEAEKGAGAHCLETLLEVGGKWV